MRTVFFQTTKFYEQFILSGIIEVKGGCTMTAHDILNNPFLNKGTAFTFRGAKGTRPYWFTATVCSND